MMRASDMWLHPTTYNIILYLSYGTRTLLERPGHLHITQTLVPAFL